MLEQLLVHPRIRFQGIAQRDKVVASYAVLSSVGRLSSLTLRLRVDQYKPAVHYEQVRNEWIGVRTPDGR